MSSQTSPLTRFVSQVLDRNNDGRFDATELSPEQMCKLLGIKETQAITENTINDMVTALETATAGSTDAAAALITQALQSNDGQYMSLSGYSALHIIHQLGLTVNEGRIHPDTFKASVKKYLDGKPCTPPRYITDRPTTAEVADRFTLSNYNRVSVTHVEVSLQLDFETHHIAGTATYTLGRQDEGQLVLDTEALIPTQAWVTLKNTPNVRISAPFTLGKERPYLGSPLTITIPPKTHSVVIEYHTNTEDDKRASGLQWLPKEQTYSGNKPFFFTQGQYFHNRGLLPLQDTPAAKITATITISVPHDLGLRVVAAGDEPHHGEPQTPTRHGNNDVWTYRTTQAVSPYLLTIAAGEIDARKVSDRSILYAEPHLIDIAAKDFEHFDDMLKTAEDLFGPLPCRKMDTLIMPPSFPYGGMENHGLNMDSNTVITGDQSLMDVPIHEFIHSWFGNLVTNTRLEDFWINEGFTMYAQRLVMERYLGRETAILDAFVGREAIEDDLSTVGESQNSCLATQVTVENSDEVMTYIPYEKGFLFVKWLEEKFGHAEFIAFVRGYLQHFARKTLTTADFEKFLVAKLPMQQAGVTQDQLDEWLYGPGIPSNAPTFESHDVALVQTTIKTWMAAGTTAFTIDNAATWSVRMWVYFLAQLLRSSSIPQNALTALHQDYHLSETHNAEIAVAWYTLVAKNRYTPAYNGMRHFLDGSVGRLKMLMPIFQTLKSAGDLPVALEIYKTLRPKIHAISKTALDGKLGYNPL